MTPTNPQPSQHLAPFPTALRPATSTPVTAPVAGGELVGSQPDSTGREGWTVEQLPPSVGAVVCLATSLAGSLASFAVAAHIGLHAGDLTGVTVAVGGSLASTAVGMFAAHRRPPADLSVRPAHLQPLSLTGEAPHLPPVWAPPRITVTVHSLPHPAPAPGPVHQLTASRAALPASPSSARPR